MLRVSRYMKIPTHDPSIRTIAINRRAQNVLWWILNSQMKPTFYSDESSRLRGKLYMKFSVRSISNWLFGALPRLIGCVVSGMCADFNEPKYRWFKFSADRFRLYVHISRCALAKCALSGLLRTIDSMACERRLL